MQKYNSRCIEKVRNFLYQMGAWSSYTLGPSAVKTRRKFRKMKRLAFKRCPEWKSFGAYVAIYHAFNLVRYSRNGLWWPDYQNCFKTPRWDRDTNKMVYDEPKIKWTQYRK